MYRKGKEYDRMAQLVIQLYLDYDLKGFPLNEKELCQKLGIALVPYSEYELEDRKVLLARSEYGFFVPLSIKNRTPPMIFYNDTISSSGCIRQTIFHEVKHYIDEDSMGDPADDDLADYFGKYLACPIPYLLVNNISSQSEIISIFGASSQMASYIVRNLENRIHKYGTSIFEYEVPLVKHLCPVVYKIFYEGRRNAIMQTKK